MHKNTLLPKCLSAWALLFTMEYGIAEPHSLHEAPLHQTPLHENNLYKNHLPLKNTAFEDLLNDTYKLMDENWQRPSGGFCSSGRAATWCALGLLHRNASGDIEKASDMLTAVLSHQINAPGKYYHGAFVRRFLSPEEYNKLDLFNLSSSYFDYNYREFVGNAFILMLIEFSDVLPEELVKKMHDAVYLMAEGAYLRNMSAEYSNIAVMQAYLLHYAGIKYNQPRWEKRSRALSGDIVRHFRENGTINEYNSPTYDGVTLIALSMWRQHGLTRPFRAYGEVVYRELWENVLKHYHPKLRNFVGPWFRAYGNDVTQYVAMTGLLLNRNLPAEQWPSPDGEIRSMRHRHDFGTLPMADLLDVSLPKKLWRELYFPTYDRSFSEYISRDPVVKSSAYMGEDYMFGALYAERGMVHHQSKPITIHWQTITDDIGAITLSSGHHTKATAESGVLEVEINNVVKVRKNDNPEHIRFDVDIADSAELLSIEQNQWAFAGRTFEVKTDATFIDVVKNGSQYHITYQFNTESGNHFEIR
ncbi:hypothetical protein [Marinibactrum halimedae]|uniref:Uncharacterized protein n=1 Tax=Marinibactrum halimedae TaxID=1444977 RepID=A0AA37WNV7_9GAMM|nr:hypothetical protein [Marinibactrum halimedae]MCD9460080.1 hypothetical protein [Marinibactrum halimedae]GLS26481.1 hypothetical protein GCM10007877_21970 [Marinibactrum halimedae]